MFTDGELQNVMNYLDRVKDLYWSDWEELKKNAKCDSVCSEKGKYN